MDQWSLLTPELQLEVASHLPPGEVAGCLKFVDWATYRNLHSTYETIRLTDGEPWPAQAFLLYWGRSEWPWRGLRVLQRRKLLCLAAGSGHAPSLAAALSYCGCSLRAEVMAAAAAAGDVAACETLLEAGCCWGNVVTMAAAAQGRIEVLEWLLQHDFEFEEHTEYSTNGVMSDAEVDPDIQSAIDESDNADDEFREAAHCPRTPAAHGGHAAVLAWFDEQGFYEQCDDPNWQLWLVRAAGQGGHAALAAQLVQQAADAASDGSESDDDPDAAQDPEDEEPFLLEWDEESPRWLRAKALLFGLALGCSLAELKQHGAAAVAAVRRRGSTAGKSALLRMAACSLTSDWADKVDYLLKAWKLVSWGDASDKDGHGLWERTARDPSFVPRLQHLRSRGFCFPDELASAAARAGNLEALKFLLDARTEKVTDEETQHLITTAACGGQAAVLQWFRQQNRLKWHGRWRHSAVLAAKGAALSWMVELEVAEVQQAQQAQQDDQPPQGRDTQKAAQARDGQGKEKGKQEQLREVPGVWYQLRKAVMRHGDDATVRRLVEGCSMEDIGFQEAEGCDMEDIDSDEEQEGWCGVEDIGFEDWDMLVCGASVELLEWMAARRGAPIEVRVRYDRVGWAGVVLRFLGAGAAPRSHVLVLVWVLVTVGAPTCLHT